jgi:CRP-like cAMP-binding protein
MFEFKPQAYADSEIIFSIGDLAEHLYFIEDGQVDLVNTQGNVFASAFAGQSFGEAAILEGGVRSAGRQVRVKVSSLSATPTKEYLM